MKKVLSLILMLAMLTSVTAALAEGETINVGCLQDLSGPTSSLGNMVTAGVQWAVDEINARLFLIVKQVAGFLLKGVVYSAAVAHQHCGA